jgi:hypothetical protein
MDTLRAILFEALMLALALIAAAVLGGLMH